MLVGGAAINRRFGWRILFTEDGQAYEPGVFYCKDAFEGLAVMDALSDPARREPTVERLRLEAEHELSRPASPRRSAPARLTSNIPPADLIPQPPSWGARVVRQMPLEIVFKHLFKNELFRLSWGAKNAHGEEWEKLQAEFEARLERMQRQARREGWLKPQAVYGYWPAQADGDDLIVYDPDSLQSAAAQPVELARFQFPRQPYSDLLCLADYFAPAGSGKMDVVAFQVVTVGQEATKRFRPLAGRRGLRRSLLHPWAGRSDRRSHRRIPAPPHPPRAGPGGGAGQALLVGLSGHPRPVRSP